MPYQTVGSLKLHFPGHEKYTDYYRDLNIENAVATVSYKVGDVTYIRTLFTSLADNALIIHLEADRPHSIAFEASYSTPFEESAVIASKNRLTLSAKASAHEEVPAAIRLESQARIKTSGGKVESDNGKLIVTEADVVTIYVSAATNFVNYQDVSANESKRVDVILNQVGKSHIDNFWTAISGSINNSSEGLN